MTDLRLATFLQQARARLQPISATPEQEARTLIQFVTQHDLCYQITHPEQWLDEKSVATLQKMCQRREQGEPLAYIIGQQGFWTLNLAVNRHTLIPRPETEHLVEWILNHFPASPTKRLLDLGTGCGTIALALASERPHWHITATDISQQALRVARRNASSLELGQVQFLQSNWCDKLPDESFDIIVSNPPYIAPDDPHLSQLTFEPSEALSCDQQGFSAIQTIMQQAQTKLVPGGTLIIEHGYQQQPTILQWLSANNYTQAEGHRDFSGHPRFVVAVAPG